MKTQSLGIAILLPWFLVQGLFADFVYTVDFNGTNLDGRLYTEIPPQFGVTLTGTQLKMFKDEGADFSPDIANVYSSFYLTGDFRVSIRSFRGPGKASVGLSIQSTTTEHWQAMYMTGPAHLWAAFCHPSGCNSHGYVDDQVTDVVFRIRREGTVVTSEFDAGGGFLTLMETDLEGFDLPMRLKLFMVQQNPGAYPPPYTDAASALFDDLHFESQGVQNFIPGTFTTAATISPELHICWPTETGSNYQLQWAPTLDAENWLNVGGPAIGSGSTTCFQDLEAVEDTRFYRVETLPE